MLGSSRSRRTRQRGTRDSEHILQLSDFRYPSLAFFLLTNLSGNKKKPLSPCAACTQSVSGFFDSFPLSLAALAFPLVPAGTGLSVPNRTWDCKGYRGVFQLAEHCRNTFLCRNSHAQVPSPFRLTARVCQRSMSGVLTNRCGRETFFCRPEKPVVPPDSA